jgi:hypothetical protein
MLGVDTTESPAKRYSIEARIAPWASERQSPTRDCARTRLLSSLASFRQPSGVKSLRKRAFRVRCLAKWLGSGAHRAFDLPSERFQAPEVEQSGFPEPVNWAILPSNVGRWPSICEMSVSMPHGSQSKRARPNFRRPTTLSSRQLRHSRSKERRA